MKLSLLTLTGLLSSPLSAQFQPTETLLPLAEEEKVLGHNDLRYRVIRDWAKVDREVAPVINAHAMVASEDGFFYLVNDHPRNAIIVLKPDGTYVRSFGEGLKGGHGIDLIQEDDRELIIHVDCGWEFSAEGKATKKTGSVNLLTKQGELVRTLPSPIDLGLEDEGTYYGPCDVAVTADNEILVIDGYSTNRILHFTIDGELIRDWGGRKPGKDSDISNGHGISIDESDPENPVLWVSSREQNQLKRFTLEGKHLETIPLPGAYAGQAVFHGDHIYTGVCWSKDPKTGKRLEKSGFVAVLDRTTKQVVSAPGGSEPVFKNEKLQPLHQTHPVFLHVHDLMVDELGNIYVMEWNAACRYPFKLELIQE
ncbi:MAG: 6-bladed beta-propeller [Roseibacillus sp.]